MRSLIAGLLCCVACRTPPAAQPPSPAVTAPAQPRVAGAAAAPVASAAPGAGAAADRVTLVFAASTAGQLVPCGCSPDQRGGLPRAVAYVNKLRAEVPNFLYADAGDLLFESAARPAPQLVTQNQLKAQVLAQGEELLGAAARTVGRRDLALGADFLAQSSKVPLLDAGASVPGARASVLAQAGAVKVGLFAAGSGENPQATIAARARQLRAEGARLVVLLLQPAGDSAFGAAQALVPAAREAGVDLIVLGKRDDPATDPNRKDASSPPVLAPEGHGQSLLRIDLQLGKGPVFLARGAEDKSAEQQALDERIARFRRQAGENPQRRAALLAKVQELEDRKKAAQGEVESAPAGATLATAVFVPLDSKLPDDPEAKKLVAAYDARVAQLNLEEAKTQPATCPAARKAEASFVGAHRCAECHATEATFWEQTRHAHAFATLVTVNKQFSLDCIRCHVSGWQQPGGVCRIDKAAEGGPGIGAGKKFGVGRQDVQCEACHGAGSEHADDPPEHIDNKVAVNVCLRCHEAANSPHFDDAKYRPFIIGPGHGMPLARGEKPHPLATSAGPLQ
jgi:hypothetical protein